MDKKKVIEIAESQIGYKEKSENITKYAKFFDDEYPNFYNTKKQGAEWCDIFVDWCFVQAYGFEKALKLLCQPTKSCGAGVSFSYDYFKKKGKVGSEPKVGAQIFFRASKDAKKPNHTGLVVAVTKTDKYYEITTIEGNKSNSVKKCTYKTDAKIFGFGYPDYEMDEKAEEKPAEPAKPTPAPAPSKPKDDGIKEYVVISKSGVNVRAERSINAKKLKPALDYGQTVRISKSVYGWYKLADRAGWCAMRFKGHDLFKLKG